MAASRAKNILTEEELQFFATELMLDALIKSHKNTLSEHLAKLKKKFDMASPVKLTSPQKSVYTSSPNEESISAEKQIESQMKKEEIEESSERLSRIGKALSEIIKSSKDSSTIQIKRSLLDQLIIALKDVNSLSLSEDSEALIGNIFTTEEFMHLDSQQKKIIILGTYEELTKINLQAHFRECTDYKEEMIHFLRELSKIYKVETFDVSMEEIQTTLNTIPQQNSSLASPTTTSETSEPAAATSPLPKKTSKFFSTSPLQPLPSSSETPEETARKAANAKKAEEKRQKLAEEKKVKEEKRKAEEAKKAEEEEIRKAIEKKQKEEEEKEEAEFRKRIEIEKEPTPAPTHRRSFSLDRQLSSTADTPAKEPPTTSTLPHRKSLPLGAHLHSIDEKTNPALFKKALEDYLQYLINQIDGFLDPKTYFGFFSYLQYDNTTNKIRLSSEKTVSLLRPHDPKAAIEFSSVIKEFQSLIKNIEIFSKDPTNALTYHILLRQQIDIFYVKINKMYLDEKNKVIFQQFINEVENHIDREFPNSQVARMRKLRKEIYNEIPNALRKREKFHVKINNFNQFVRDEYEAYKKIKDEFKMIIDHSKQSVNLEPIIKELISFLKDHPEIQKNNPLPQIFLNAVHFAKKDKAQLEKELKEANQIAEKLLHSPPPSPKRL